MVTKWGFSDRVGYVYHSGKAHADHSPAPDTLAAIDAEVQRLCDESYARATKILTAQRAELDLVASELLAKETLTGAQLRAILAAARASPAEPAPNDETEAGEPAVAEVTIAARPRPAPRPEVVG